MFNELRKGDMGTADDEVTFVVCKEDSVVAALANGAVDESGESMATEDKALGFSSDLL